MCKDTQQLLFVANLPLGALRKRDMLENHGELIIFWLVVTGTGMDDFFIQLGM